MFKMTRKIPALSIFVASFSIVLSAGYGGGGGSGSFVSSPVSISNANSPQVAAEGLRFRALPKRWINVTAPVCPVA